LEQRDREKNVGQNEGQSRSGKGKILTVIKHLSTGTTISRAEDTGTKSEIGAYDADDGSSNGVER
jgi:hypothetical protein